MGRRVTPYGTGLWALVGIVGVSPLAGAEAPPPSVDVETAPVIYGEDDRTEVYLEESDLLRELAQRSSVALVSPWELSYDSAGTVSIEASTFEESNNVCPGEPFGDQPAAAFCSGVLIDDDLVATAGHCLGDTPGELEDACRTTAFVFGYSYTSEGQLSELSADHVYRCKRTVAWSYGPTLDVPDYGVVQLDRPVTGELAPAAMAATPVELGDRVHVIGYGSGLPGKVDSGGIVTEISEYEQFFGATTDTFAGASGSPLFNDEGEIVGIHVRGQTDFDFQGSCFVSAYAFTGDETHQRATAVNEVVCDSGWPSERLCGTNSDCGDGICSADESTSSCAVDCPASTCGDGICEGQEPLQCREDCPSYDDIPSDWTCPRSYFGDRAGCDCDCGARDIDCDIPTEPVLGCFNGWTCNQAGTCIPPLSEEEEAEAAMAQASGAGGERSPDAAENPRSASEGSGAEGSEVDDSAEEGAVDLQDLLAAEAAPAKEEDGCGCSVPGTPGKRHGPLAFMAGLLVICAARTRRHPV